MCHSWYRLRKTLPCVTHGIFPFFKSLSVRPQNIIRSHCFPVNAMSNQGRRKQFFSGQANQLQLCLYREFRMIIFTQSTISMGNVLMLRDLTACPLEKNLKNRCFEIEFEGILGSQPCIIAIHAGSYQVTVCQTIARTCSC